MRWDLDALKLIARNETVPGVALRDAIAEIEHLRTRLKAKEIIVKQKQAIITIPFGLMLSVVETLRTVKPGASLTSNFPISRELVTALQAELRTRGERGEALASELSSLIEFEEAKSEHA